MRFPPLVLGLLWVAGCVVGLSSNGSTTRETNTNHKLDQSSSIEGSGKHTSDRAKSTLVPSSRSTTGEASSTLSKTRRPTVQSTKRHSNSFSASSTPSTDRISSRKTIAHSTHRASSHRRHKTNTRPTGAATSHSGATKHPSLQSSQPHPSSKSRASTKNHSNSNHASPTKSRLSPTSDPQRTRTASSRTRETTQRRGKHKGKKLSDVSASASRQHPDSSMSKSRRSSESRDHPHPTSNASQDRHRTSHIEGTSRTKETSKLASTSSSSTSSNTPTTSRVSSLSRSSAKSHATSLHASQPASTPEISWTTQSLSKNRSASHSKAHSKGADTLSTEHSVHTQRQTSSPSSMLLSSPKHRPTRSMVSKVTLPTRSSRVDSPKGSAASTVKASLASPNMSGSRGSLGFAKDRNLTKTFFAQTEKSARPTSRPHRSSLVNYPAPVTQTSRDPTNAKAPSHSYEFLNTQSLVLPQYHMRHDGSTAAFGTSLSSFTTGSTSASATSSVKLNDSSRPNSYPESIVPQHSNLPSQKDTTLVSVLFKSSLPWSWLVRQRDTTAQIFTYMPLLLAQGINVSEHEVYTKQLRAYPINNTVRTLYLAYIPTSKAPRLEYAVQNPADYLVWPDMEPVEKSLLEEIDPGSDLYMYAAAVPETSTEIPNATRNALVGSFSGVAGLALVGFFVWLMQHYSRHRVQRKKLDRRNTIQSFSALSSSPVQPIQDIPLAPRSGSFYVGDPHGSSVTAFESEGVTGTYDVTLPDFGMGPLAASYSCHEHKSSLPYTMSSLDAGTERRDCYSDLIPNVHASGTMPRASAHHRMRSGDSLAVSK